VKCAYNGIPRNIAQYLLCKLLYPEFMLYTCHAVVSSTCFQLSFLLTLFLPSFLLTFISSQLKESICSLPVFRLSSFPFVIKAVLR
jgi:hypothetical protein